MILRFAKFAGVGLAAVAALAATSASAATIANASFETPYLGTGYYGAFVYNPTVTGNVFSDASGVQGNGSGWGFVDAPDGTQTAFLQSYFSAFGTIAMAVTGLQNGGKYSVNFSLADRPGYGDNPVTVYFNAGNLGTFAAPSDAWTSATTATFVASGTSGTLLFAAAGNTGYDAGIGIDAVSIAGGVPEPASWALMIGGFGLVGSVQRLTMRRRRAVALTA